jgi:hypothetical protein
MRFPGTRNNSSPAGGDPHWVMNVCGDGAHKVEVSGVRANGHPTLGPLISTEEGYNMAATAADQEAGRLRKRERRP